MPRSAGRGLYAHGRPWAHLPSCPSEAGFTVLFAQNLLDLADLRGHEGPRALTQVLVSMPKCSRKVKSATAVMGVPQVNTSASES